MSKKAINEKESLHSYFNDVRTQCEAQRFATEYNKYNPPKKVAFLHCSVIQLIDRPKQPFFCMEDYLHGKYIKHLDNHGGDDGNFLLFLFFPVFLYLFFFFFDFL